jgi:hypothetical protein
MSFHVGVAKAFGPTNQLAMVDLFLPAAQYIDSTHPV